VNINSLSRIEELTMGALQKIQNWSLSARVTVMVVGMMILLATTTSIVSNALSYGQAQKSGQERQETNMRVAWDVLRQYGSDFHVDGDKLIAGQTVLNNLDAPVDHVKKLVGGTATVFLGDKRVATNIVSPEGGRAVGTSLTSDDVRQTVLVEGKPYRGSAKILGETYFTAYDPIRAADGKVIGILYVGIPAARYLEPVVQVSMVAIAISTLATLLAAWACLHITRRMFKPMDEICTTIEGMANGKHDIMIAHADKQDEIGAIARGLVVFQQSEAEKRRADADQARAMDIVAGELARLAGGDLTTRIGDRLPSAYRRLGTDFDAAVDGLGVAISSIKTSSGDIHQTAVEIRTASNDLSLRTERQAASLEETAASMRQLASAAGKSATIAGDANTAMVTVRAELVQSDEVITQAMSAMQDIEKSSHEIAAIASMIDGIAFQTNLLALNAGVEAARAGEAGNGFAVVASEVRSLAQRSAEAASDVKQLIGRSSEQVGAGVKVVERVSQTLRQASQNITGLDAMLDEIAQSASQQSENVAQINVAISEMNEMTQQNAAMVEEATAATKGLSDGAEYLTGEVARFRIEEEEARGHGLRRVA
jgi:methyl-accepting chemotaxis protein